MGRRLCIIGFCRSIEMLSDVVEDSVLEQGGEVCSNIACFFIFIITCSEFGLCYLSIPSVSKNESHLPF